MTQEIWIELIRVVGPGLTAFALVVIFLFAFRGPLRHEVLPRLGSMKALGVELTFVRAELERAADSAPVQVSAGDRSGALRRAQKAAPLLAGARALWIDDQPDNNLVERNILGGLGISIDIARSSDEARSSLGGRRYDVVVSDINREGKSNEGVRFLKEMWDGHFYRWTVLYVRQLDPRQGTPPYAFAITNRPDHLLHYVIDILERERS